MRRYGLHDDEWERIKDLLPGRVEHVGVVVYGAVWKANPRLVAWYSWLTTEIPVNGSVEVSGSVEIQEPLKVEIDR